VFILADKCELGLDDLWETITKKYMQQYFQSILPLMTRSLYLPHIGRLLDFLKSIGEFENTVIMVISDNGASSEGGPTGSVNENLFNSGNEFLTFDLQRQCNSDSCTMIGFAHNI
jgi:membrane-anchored protein YejM (alkaline phosphatase superfamily)